MRETFLAGGPFGFHPLSPFSGLMPSTAVISPMVIKPAFEKNSTIASASDMARSQKEAVDEELLEIMLCMTAAVHAAPEIAASWFEWDDISMMPWQSGMSITSSELARSPASVMINAQEVVPLCTSYFALNQKIRMRVRRGLDRLHRSMRRHDPADQAVELGTALDLLLVGDRGEHTWKVSFRAALLASSDSAMRIRHRETIKKVYDLRSKVVHSGASGDLNDRQLVDEGIKIAAAVFKSIIFRGKIPDWPSFEFEQL